MEAKDILSYLGLKEDIKDLDAFKDAYNKEYIKRSLAEKDEDIISKINGKFAGSTLTAIKRMAKASNITLEKDLLENKTVQEIIDFIGDNVGKTIDSVKTEYETKLKATETDAVKEWKEKHEKLESKYRDTDSLVKTMKEQLAQKDNEFKSKIKEFKLGDVKKSAFGSIKFANTVDDLKKRGFETLINEKYELDLDDTENVFVKDKKTGQRIPNPSKNGEFLSYSDVLSQEAEKNNLVVKNNGGTGTFTTFVQNGNGGNNGADPNTGNKNTGNLRATPASQR